MLMRNEDNDPYNNLVVRILDALQKPDKESQSTGDSEGSGDLVDFEEDKALMKYQKEARADEMARREVAKLALKMKKGRSSPY